MPPAVFADLLPGLLSPGFQIDAINLLAILGALVALWVAFRRKPPLDSELTGLKMSVDALTKIVSGLTQCQLECASRRHEIAGIAARVSKLEALRESDFMSQRDYTRSHAQEIFAKIDGVKDSIAANFQSLEGRLGKIEGTITMVRDGLNLRNSK